jgi:lysozyme
VQSIDEWRKAAMLDLAFNMGIPTLLKFTNTLGYLHTGKYTLASNGLKMSRWAGQVQKQRVTTIADIIRNGTLADNVKSIYRI